MKLSATAFASFSMEVLPANAIVPDKSALAASLLACSVDAACVSAAEDAGAAASEDAGVAAVSCCVLPHAARLIIIAAAIVTVILFFNVFFIIDFPPTNSSSVPLNNLISNVFRIRYCKNTVAM